MFKVGKAVALATAVAATMAVAACGGGSSGASGTSGASSPPGTLTVWHYEGPTSAMGVAWAEAVTQFKASHPGVTVKVEEKGFEQIQKTAPMVLNSKDAPDVLEYNKGNATAGLLSK